MGGTLFFALTSCLRSSWDRSEQIEKMKVHSEALSFQQHLTHRQEPAVMTQQSPDDCDGGEEYLQRVFSQEIVFKKNTHTEVTNEFTAYGPHYWAFITGCYTRVSRSTGHWQTKCSGTLPKYQYQTAITTLYSLGIKSSIKNQFKSKHNQDYLL